MRLQTAGKTERRKRLSVEAAVARVQSLLSMALTVLSALSF
jgi:hypothetical protein